MGFQIENGVGTGHRARVTSENQLKTEAEIHELQHHVAREHGQSYQIIGEHDLASAGTKTLLHITNNDPERDITVSYMRLQFPGGDGTIDALTYYQLGFGTVYGSGGAAASPINTNSKSGNLAVVTSYQDAPTVTGTFTEVDRWYADKSMQTFNKHGSIILGLNDTMEWRLVTDQTSGLAYCRVTFMMLEIDD